MVNPTLDVDWSESETYERFDLSCPMGDSDYHEKLQKKGEYCDCCTDNNGYIEPMMNYVWKLEIDRSYDAEERAKLRKKVAEWCGPIQVIFDNNDDSAYLCLCGGGMDFSPFIALAYAVWEKWIPYDLVTQLDIGWCKTELGARSRKFRFLKACVTASLTLYRDRANERLGKWTSKKVKVGVA